MSHQTGQQNMNTITGLLSLISAISGLLFIWWLGLGEAWNVLSEGTVTAATTAAYGGSIGIMDMFMTFAIIALAIGSSGLGIYATSHGSPNFLKAVERNLPMIVGVIALVGFLDVAVDVLQGDRVWGNFSNVQNAYNIFIASGMAVAISTFFGNKAEY